MQTLWQHNRWNRRARWWKGFGVELLEGCLDLHYALKIHHFLWRLGHKSPTVLYQVWHRRSGWRCKYRASTSDLYLESLLRCHTWYSTKTSIYCTSKQHVLCTSPTKQGNITKIHVTFRTQTNTHSYKLMKYCVKILRNTLTASIICCAKCDYKVLT
jgi:hypothetical protein